MLTFRLAVPEDLPALETLILDAFEPITWFKKLDQSHGPLNGVDWRERWRVRLAGIFATQILLVGEADGSIAAVATGTYDARTALGYVDLLAVDQRYQGRGYGRTMLRGFVDHVRALGARYCHLECLADNVVGNELYGSEGWEIVARSNRWFIDLERAALPGEPQSEL